MDTKRLWFNVAVCDRHWEYVYPYREPTRLLGNGEAKDYCVKCDEPLTNPIYVWCPTISATSKTYGTRTCWSPMTGQEDG